MNRRKFLSVVGGGVVLSAGVAATGYVATRTPESALAPWQNAGKGYTEPRMRALSYAILAPNPHNQQPWLVDLSEQGKVKLLVDLTRLLPHTDPYNRQITIGLGCFLELMRIAAAEDGYKVTFDHFPEGHNSEKLDDRPVTIATFVKDETAEKDTLFRQILNRRSVKTPYDLNRSVPEDVLNKIINLQEEGVWINGTIQSGKVKSLRTLTRNAMQVEIDTPRTYKESVDLFRIGKSEIEKNPDGLSFPGIKFELLSMFGMFTREVALDRDSSGFKQGAEQVLSQSDTAMAFIWLTTKSNTRLDQLNAGRVWVRVNLLTTRLGIGLHPMSQALQEYGEMKEKYDECHKMLAEEGERVQMLGRMGYAVAVNPTPRWPIGRKLLKA
ncbi:MAG: Acg family FMN-binding oxidoreductase [Methyloligellaceae bacterium]